MAGNVIPPAPAEERAKKGVIEDVKVEGTKKTEDENPMDVGWTSIQPPLKETTKHPNEHPSRHPVPTPTDRKEAEDSPHVH